MFKLDTILRDNIKKVKPYSSARDEYQGTEGIFLDANENSYGSVIEGNYNRYPDPLQKDLKEHLASLKKIETGQIFLGNGSDEPIDLLMRMVCRPGVDNIIILPPTYGMYEVSAGINDVKIKTVPLIPETFQINEDAVLKAIDANTKIIFVCSPNNPTGNSIKESSMIKLLEKFDGIVVIDEAYIDFSTGIGMVRSLAKYPNMVILQTFSKAWGLANLRLGMAFGSKEVIGIMNKIKAPYNINGVTQELALDALIHLMKKEQMVADIVYQREVLKEQLKNVKAVIKVYESDANFLLVKTVDASKVYKFLTDHKIVTRDRSKVDLCMGCLRITVGTEKENQALVKVLKEYK